MLHNGPIHFKAIYDYILAFRRMCQNVFYNYNVSNIDLYLVRYLAPEGRYSECQMVRYRSYKKN
jgi:hypothetical protein